MTPTIQVNEIIRVDFSAYSKTTPQRWDVVLFHPPPATGQDTRYSWDMRVIGLPGEVLSIKDDGIYVGGERQVQTEGISGIRYTLPISGTGSSISYPYTVPPDSYFVVGDNTAKAFDSRFWGALPRQNILGRVEGK